MKKYKAILLVLASEDVDNTFYIIKKICDEWKPLYPHFKNVYEQYINENPNIKVLFVYGDSPTLIANEYDLVYDVFENDYPGMITKTLFAMKDIENTYDYDFLIRTNLSTFWDLNQLEYRLDKLPKTQCLTGTPVKHKNKIGDDYHYIAGYDMIISRDLIQSILPYTNEIINQKILLDMEDLSICTAIEKYAGVKLSEYSFRNDAIVINMQCFSESQYQQYLNYQIKNNIDHFRVRNRIDRNVDKLVHSRLLWDIYGKSL